MHGPTGGAGLVLGPQHGRPRAQEGPPRTPLGGRRPRPLPGGPASLLTSLSGFKNPVPSPRAAASFGESSRHLPAGEALNLPIQDEQQRAWTALSQHPVKAASKVPSDRFQSLVSAAVRGPRLFTGGHPGIFLTPSLLTSESFAFAFLASLWCEGKCTGLKRCKMSANARNVCSNLNHRPSMLSGSVFI